MRTPLALLPLVLMLAGPAVGDPAPAPFGTPAPSPLPYPQSSAPPSSGLLPSAPLPTPSIATRAQATPPADQSAPDASFYPAAARAAGAEGQAIIRCTRTSHLQLQNCKVMLEQPAGQGFGAAALAMAAANPPNPKVDSQDATMLGPNDLKLIFSLHPPKITPDITQMAHTSTRPTILTSPTHDQVKDAYPVRALADNVQGVAALACAVTAEGKLEKCAVYGEQPGGFGFGQAALDLAGDFKMKPGQLDGAPVSGARVVVPVTFATANPDAPLELKTNP